MCTFFDVSLIMSVVFTSYPRKETTYMSSALFSLEEFLFSYCTENK